VYRSKLTLLRCNLQHRRFEALATFLENIPSSCPHELFRREDNPKACASQARPAFADADRIVKPKPLRSSSRRSAPTSYGTRRCKILCWRMIRARSSSRFPSGSPKTRSRAHCSRSVKNKGLVEPSPPAHRTSQRMGVPSLRGSGRVKAPRHTALRRA